MSALSYHPLADLFPLLDGTEFSDLVADVKAHGLLEPIIIHDGCILDGRNRYRACQAGEVPARYEPFSGTDPVAYVISINLRRRHLNESQRAMVAAKLANLADGQRADRSANLPTLPGVPAVTPPVPMARAADMLNVSERTVRAARAVQEHAVPELARKVEAGAVSVSAAADVAKLPPNEQREVVARGEREILEKAKEIRSDRAAARQSQNAALKAATPVLVAPGRYGTIVIDPPWDMQKIDRDVRPNQVAFDYPTMTEDEMAAFPVADMAADDCHLFCWTTHKFLPSALRLIEAWGFRYCLTMVWHKSGGFQPVGLPQYNCEFAVYARRGSPSFVETRAFPACFHGERREHSRKPDEFYDVIRRVTAEPRIDVFSREPRSGFSQHGNETEKFGAAA